MKAVMGTDASESGPYELQGHEERRTSDDLGILSNTTFNDFFRVAKRNLIQARDFATDESEDKQGSSRYTN